MDRERCLALGFDVDAFLRTEPSTTMDNKVETHLYVISCAQYVKVGIATDISKRVATFQTGNPFPISILRQLKFKSRLHALLVERTVHGVLADERFYSEWFVCTPERAMAVADAVSDAMRLLEVEFRRKEQARINHWRDKYHNDPKYRAKVDAERADTELNMKLYRERDAAVEKARREFNEASREKYPEIAREEEWMRHIDRKALRPVKRGLGSTP